MTGPGLAEVEAQVRKAMDAGRWEEVQRLLPTLDALEQPRPAPSLLGAALWYAQQGMHVFPLQPFTKIPMPGSRGCKDATADEQQVRAWWRASPQANIGLATGHLVDVVDFDGALGHAAWGAWWSAHQAQDDGTLTPGAELLATVSTPRPGGLHAYVRAAGAGNGANLMPGVDHRGLGGYVVAPPSRLDDRPGQQPGTYAFLRPFQPDLTPW